MTKITELLREWNAENRMRKSERYHYLSMINQNPECATHEDVEEATGLISDLETNKSLDANDVIPRNGYVLLVLLGAILAVLPICWITEIVATKAFGFANCSVPYWCTYAGMLLVLGSLWANLWLRAMEGIKNALMAHRIQKLSIWKSKAVRSVILDDHMEELLKLDNSIE